MADAEKTKVAQDKGNGQALERPKEQLEQFASAGPAADVLALHDAAGNQAVNYWLRSHFQRLGLQTMPLTLSHADDRQEREATHMAEQSLYPPQEERSFQLPTKQRAASSNRRSSSHKSRPGPLSLPGGQPLPGAFRATFESRFGYDLSDVRLHTTAEAATMARAFHADAFTVGANIIFNEGAFAPGTPTGKQLLAHELAHVIQQRQTGPVPAALVQRQPTSRDSLQRQLREKEAEVARLRQRADELMDAAAKAQFEDISRESGRRTTERARADVRSASGQSPIPSSALDVLNRAIRVQQSEKTVRLIVTIQFTFLGLSEKAGRERAKNEIPRIVNAIREGWTIQFSQGARQGQTFTLDPQITYRPPSEARDPNAWQIEVRPRDDKQGSTGSWWNGIISLNPVHLKGDRVRTVAHEVYHLFGFTDAYLTMTTGKGKNKQKQAAVGREDPANRPDLLGLTDPVVLKRWLRKGIITQEQFKRQTQAIARVWEEDAEEILRALAVPTPQQQRLEQTGKAIRRSKKTLNSIEWLKTVENIMRLEDEIAALKRQLSSAPAPSGGQP